jgi:hypothetical protein
MSEKMYYPLHLQNMVDKIVDNFIKINLDISKRFTTFVVRFINLKSKICVNTLLTYCSAYPT